jgi:hypothetical protein
VNIYLVRVTTDDREHHIWAAATSREEAVDRVLDRVPEGWTARLMNGRRDAGQDVLASMKPGEIRELAVARKPDDQGTAKALTRP